MSGMKGRYIRQIVWQAGFMPAWRQVRFRETPGNRHLMTAGLVLRRLSARPSIPVLQWQMRWINSVEELIQKMGFFI